MLRPYPARLLFCWCLFAMQWATAASPIEVRVGMGLAKPPYIMESGKDGIEVEIAEQALAASGYKMVALQFPQARALAMQRSGQLDAMLGVDEGIGGKDFFSDPYVVYQNVAITLSSRNIQLKRIEDLAGYSVAGFQNARMVLGERFKAVMSTHEGYKEHPQQMIQNNLLFTGHVDVVIGDWRIFRYLSQHMDAKIDATQPITLHHIFPPNPRKAVFLDAQLRDQFNAGLKTIRSNGVYDGILKKYASFLQP